LLRDSSHARGALGEAKNLYRPTASTEFARASRDPKRWRQIDRVYRFDGVLLDGNPALYRPLAHHFRQSGDWVLRGLDHAALAYARAPARAWVPADLAPWREKVAGWPDRPRAAAHAQLAARLLLAGERDEARKAAEEAVRIAPSLAEGWAQKAAVSADRGAWEEALGSAEKALRLGKGNGAALSIKAQALSHLGRNEAAYAATAEWVRAEPEETQALFLHARMAHAVKAYKTESDTLRKLIALCEKDEAPVGGYRVFLGQAQAKLGEAEAAAAEFEAALGSGDLSPGEKEFAEEALGRVRP
jgi:tetratricopeptide (TPR) repeat protein